MIGLDNILLSIVFLILSIAFFVYTIYQVKRNKLLLKYSLMWILLSVFLLLFAIIPQPIFSLAHLLGFGVSSNFIFTAAIFFLLLLCLGQSRAISQHATKTIRITQELALQEKRIKDLEQSRTSDDVLSR